MKYLLYFIDGFIKKFPLNKPTSSIGRSRENDLTIEDEFLSRKHLDIFVKDDLIIIKDQDSLNGTYVNQTKIKEAIIKIGNSFILGGLEFFLKEGKMDEFKPAKELIPIFNKISRDHKKKFRDIETKYIKDIYNETLKQILKTGLSKNNFNSFILDLSNHIFNLINFGSLFIVSKQNNDFNISLSVKRDTGVLKLLKKILKENPNLFSKNITLQQFPNTTDYFSSYPFKINNLDSSLIYISKKSQKQKDLKIEKFISTLSKEIALFSQFLTDDRGNFDTPDFKMEIMDDFIVGSKKMKEIIKQAIKIAKSDMFVLIQGESGTGKELLAKLIHNHSKRCNNKLVAINCAAIPETLLESELFGYEKGAFTGAYTQKKGKLEMASNSTLILDEIADMPLNLQSKLLRALQENEFYRLGSTSTVKVDLRVISTTNQNLKQMIKENKFREDLYYRIVHRIIYIPPLRERKEDISILMNFFTNKFCQQSNKTINGYSVKAFETLLNYPWRGNVRQLKNEINSIINLTDNREMITFDILSDDIKFNEDDFTQTSELSAPKYEESEKETIIRILKRNNWNKSKAARELQMTYQGLHKKMKRLGIQSMKRKIT